jgi:hypothetical protein
VADWKARPLKQSSLFWSKTSMILGVMVLQITSWQSQNLHPMANALQKCSGFPFEEALDHPGGDLFPVWLHENFETLTFNKKTKRFSLK